MVSDRYRYMQGQGAFFITLLAGLFFYDLPAQGRGNLFGNLALIFGVQLLCVIFCPARGCGVQFFARLHRSG